MTDVGQKLFCRVTATNASGAAQAFSNVVGPVAAATPAGGSTWNPADVYTDANADLVFSDGNRTVAGRLLFGFPYCQTRGTLGHSTGKKYFEATLNTAPSNEAYFGISDGVFALTASSIAGVTNSKGIVVHSSALNLLFYDASNNSYNLGATVTYANGDVAAFAVDLDAKLLWYRHNGTWLGVSADPATGANGLDWVTGATGTPTLPMFPYYCVKSGLNPDFSVTINTGPTFAHAVPSGFTAWG